ncbi:RNA-directed DNA polymerase, eukaryota, reverse transcriptase zinc-binding domain protein [Tanacetum coccineum]
MRDKLKSVHQFPYNAQVKEVAVKVLNDYNEVMKDEESLLFQKAKVNWMREGDKNTAFFHTVVKKKFHRSRIVSICDENGVRYENEHVTGYNEEAGSMVNSVNEKEIKEALFDIDDQKAPGSDGFSAKFFKSDWDIIGNELNTPNKVFDYRPIACCNVMYKCISKILTNRIKRVLGKLVDENQSAFIPGRQITDNIILVQELLRGYNRKHQAKKCSFKIHIQKAYDTVNWEFLRATLRGFGFHSKMINWIMVCVTTTKFSVRINGNREGYFKSDDLIVLCNGDIQSVSVIKQALEEFSNISGLKPYLNKSTVFFRGLNIEEQNKILQILPFSIGKLPARYLGVPLITKQLSVKDFFQIPKSVIKEINSLFKGFLWCQGELGKGKTKITWSTVCKPKDQRGLGLKDMNLWNEALLSKHIWNIVAKKDSMWVKWIHEERLKGTSIWKVEPDVNASWGWRNLLKIRDKIRHHVFHKIGNGKGVSAWHDRWHDLCPLDQYITNRDLYEESFSQNDIVADLVDNGVWKWSNRENRNFEMLNQIPVPLLHDNVGDVIK